MLLVVLDINGTLVHASRVRGGQGEYLGQARTKHIFARPCLEAFLKALCEEPNVRFGLWTSCIKENAEALADCLIKRYPFIKDHVQFVLNQSHCAQLPKHMISAASPYKTTVKDLRIIKGVPLDRMLLIDDTASKAWLHPEQHLTIKEYDPADLLDRELLRILEEIRKRAENTTQP